jgi:hypothetical protein
VGDGDELRGHLSDAQCDLALVLAGFLLQQLYEDLVAGRIQGVRVLVEARGSLLEEEEAAFYAEVDQGASAKGEAQT